jgi:hypothetical protein
VLTQGTKREAGSIAFAARAKVWDPSIMEDRQAQQVTNTIESVAAGRLAPSEIIVRKTIIRM